MAIVSDRFDFGIRELLARVCRVYANVSPKVTCGVSLQMYAPYYRLTPGQIKLPIEERLLLELLTYTHRYNDGLYYVAMLVSNCIL